MARAFSGLARRTRVFEEIKRSERNIERNVKQSPTLEEISRAFRDHGFEPPPEYLWLVEHGTLGFENFSQFEPWQFCGLAEILPLSKRWPGANITRQLVPFARMQSSDDLACFEYENGNVVRVWTVHYQLQSAPKAATWLEVSNEYQSAWEWLHAALEDAKFLFNLSCKQQK